MTSSWDTVCLCAVWRAVSEAWALFSAHFQHLLCGHEVVASQNNMSTLEQDRVSAVCLITELTGLFIDYGSWIFVTVWQIKWQTNVCLFLLWKLFPILSVLELTLPTHSTYQSWNSAVYMWVKVGSGNSLLIFVYWTSDRSSLSFSSLSFTQQDAAGQCRPSEMLLSDDDGSEKEVVLVRQNNHRKYPNLTQPCPACPADSPPRPFAPPLDWTRVAAAPTAPPSSQHGYALPVEAVLPEAGLLPGQLRLHLGNDAAALHHPAASQPREQCCAASADPGPQQALHQSAGGGEPECYGRALCGYDDCLWWVTDSCNHTALSENEAVLLFCRGHVCFSVRPSCIMHSFILKVCLAEPISCFSWRKYRLHC